MINLVAQYFSRLTAGIGMLWTRFWFTPSDPATLSLIRLLVGLVAIYLHATLLWDLVPLFGPNGLLPSAEIAPIEAGNFSYLNYVSTPGELWTVHLIGLAVLVLFAAGLWTRLTSILALVVFLSDVQRAPVITSGTEPIVAMVMLYLCLAPCGRLFSLDRLLARRAARAASVEEPAGQLSTAATVATRLIQVHLALLVAMMGFSKLSGEVWWTDLGLNPAAAMWWLIARPESRLVDLTWLHARPQLIDFWTHAIVLFELAFPLLIWVPLARPLLLACAVVIWSSLALVTGDIIEALMLCIASVAFLPPSAVRSCCDRREAPPAGQVA